MRCSLSTLRQLIAYNFMQKVLFDLSPKDRVWEISLAYHLSLGIIDINLHHPVPTYLYRGCFLLTWIKSIPPLGPGTAPLTSNRFRSFRKCTTSRFCTVTRVWP